MRHFRFQVLFNDFESAKSSCARLNRQYTDYCVVEAEFDGKWYVADVKSASQLDFQYTIYF